MPPPNDVVLRTIADELLELVKKSKKISVEEAAKRLKMPSASEGLWDEFRYFKLDINNTLLYNISDQDAKRSCQ